MRPRLIVSLLICILGIMILVAGCTSAGPGPVPESDGTPAAAVAIMEKPLYPYTTWGYKVVDIATGQVLAEKNTRILFTPGSTVKLFTTAAALDLLGPDYRFRTPVYALGIPAEGGASVTNLVLVASGDPTMGGRTLPDDTIEFTNADHCDANALPGTEMTTTDPLTGLDSLAAQVKAAGITSARDVIIDDRLFVTEKLDDPAPVTPIYINDNLIDILITPGADGSRATVTSRPQSALFTVEADVTTGGSEADISITESGGVISVSGSIPKDQAPYLRTFVISDSGAWARSLFIDALERQGVAVDAPATGTNPRGSLPADYAGLKPVALLTSPPFSENVKLILKVSQNIHANALLGIMAAHEGKTTVDDGLLIEGDYFRRIGINPASLSLIDGEGSSRNRVSPDAAIDLLRVMAAGNTYPVYRAAMPVLGVDGTLAQAAAPDNPAIGKIAAKTGTSLQSDMNGDAMLVAKGLAGYMTTKSGRDVMFVLYANSVRVSSFDDLNAINTDMGSFAGVLFEAF